jgi:phytoene synthase
LFLPLDVFAAHGVSAEEVFARRASPGMTAAWMALCAQAERLFAQTATALAGLPAEQEAAFLPLAPAPAMLARLRVMANDPFAALREPSAWRRQWLIWRAARRGLARSLSTCPR